MFFCFEEDFFFVGGEEGEGFEEFLDQFCGFFATGGGFGAGCYAERWVRWCRMERRGFSNSFLNMIVVVVVNVGWCLSFVCSTMENDAPR